MDHLAEEFHGVVDLVVELEDAFDEEDPVAGGPPLGADWLESLDARRQDEPEAVAAEVAAGLDRVEPALIPRALGVWSSALRLLLELETAASLNRWAVRLAEAAGESSTIADLYIRRAYIVADAGDHARALMLAQLAAGVFASLGEPEEMARALVSCGRWFHYLGRTREAIQATEQALERLPEKEILQRFAALHGLGYFYLNGGDVAAAERFAELAEPVATTADHRARLLWLQAAICRKCGRLDQAENKLRLVVEAFRGRHHGETALSSVELLEALLEQAKPAEAWRVCQTLYALFEPLKCYPIIGAALTELLRGGAHGLHLEQVRQVRATISSQRRRNDARARQLWRALAVAD